MPRTPRHTRSAEIRAKLGHPVIDCDGHLTEFMPSIVDYLRKVGGSHWADGYLARQKSPKPALTTPNRRGAPFPGWQAHWAVLCRQACCLTRCT